MKRPEVLDAAREIVMKDRNTTHGEPEESFGRIAAYWSAHLDVTVTPADVTVMMTLLKCARIKNNPAHTDNWQDGCGYLACGCELATEGPVFKTTRVVEEWTGSGIGEGPV
jgi:hypothetical protein